MNPTNSTPSKKVMGVSYASVVQMFINDQLTTHDIALKLGCTHQRISQVLTAMGVRPILHSRVIRAAKLCESRANRAQLIAAEKKRRKARREEQQLAFDRERHCRARLLWDEGTTIQKIALHLGITTSNASVIIARMRAKYGWFPHRRSASKKKSCVC